MKIYKLLLPVFAALAISSCESYTEDLNESPNAFVVASSDLIIGQVQLAIMQHMGSNNARYGAVFSNQMSGGDRQYLTLNTYSPNRANYNDMWGDTYISGINAAQIIIDDENASALVRGVAKIIQGSLYADMALLYGAVPFSEAVNPNEFAEPAYDSQASVVNGGIAIIESGIQDVGSATIAAGYGGSRLSGGTWAEAGHTLAARYSLSVGNTAAAISHANQGISSRANDLVTQHGTSQENRNLFYQFVVDERQDYLVATDSHLANLLDGTVARNLTTPGDSARYASYFLPEGTAGTASYRTLLNTDVGGRFSQISSMPIATYYENQLILAEAKYGSDQTAAQGHLNAVRAELAVEFGASFPATTATGATLLTQIMEEKYITLVGELVTFHDLRRTNNMLGVPNKTTGSTAANGFPQRFLYPQSEVDTNSNVPSPLPEFFDATDLF